MRKGMIRKDIYDIQFTFNILGDKIYELKKNYIVFDNEKIKANSQRYKVFKNSCVCCKCGLKANYFALEKFADQNTYHLNLYGIDINGNEVLFTKDHIIPKSKGGKNTLDNYQTMCCKCNELKADKIENIF